MQDFQIPVILFFIRMPGLNTAGNLALFDDTFIGIYPDRLRKICALFAASFQNRIKKQKMATNNMQ
jgi:hypothetical protein